MPFYFGVICCELDKSMTETQGEHDWKPNTELAGWTGSCKWFTDEEKKDDFIDYATNELGYHLERM